MLVKQCHEALVVSGLNEMHHFVNYNIFEEILRFFHQFGIEANVSCPAVAASPLGFHPLQEIASNFHPQLDFPFIDERRYYLVEQGFVPFVDDDSTLFFTAPGADAQDDAFVINGNAWFVIPIDDS